MLKWCTFDNHFCETQNDDVNCGNISLIEDIVHIFNYTDELKNDDVNCGNSSLIEGIVHVFN